MELMGNVMAYLSTMALFPKIPQHSKRECQNELDNKHETINTRGKSPTFHAYLKHEYGNGDLVDVIIQPRPFGGDVALIHPQLGLISSIDNHSKHPLGVSQECALTQQSLRVHASSPMYNERLTCNNIC